MKAGWKTRSLGEVTQKMESTNPGENPDQAFDYIDVSSVSNKTFVIEETQKLLGKDAPSRARRLVRENDIIFATVRPTLQRVAVVPPELDQQVCSTGYIVLRPNSQILHRFMFHWLFTDNFSNSMARLQKGASYPAVTDGEVRSQIIPVPPLPEQQRIIAILDEAFEGIATAKANTEKNLKNAREVFENHFETRLASRGEDWNDLPLGNLCSFENGDRGTNYPSKSARTATGIPFINAGHLTEDGLDYESMDYISRERFNLLSNGKVRRGDILFCLRGSLGKFASVGDLDEGAIASSLVIVRPGKRLLNDFVLAYFGSSLCAGMISKFKNGAAQPNLSAQSLRNFVIPVPSISEQESIIGRHLELHSEISRLSAIYEQKLVILGELKQSLLHRAFNGDL